jgi:hypothetical protein
MKKERRPCIRGLKAFSRGCPMKMWDGESGCPAWIELLVTPRNEPAKPKDKVGRCIDHWMLELKLSELGLLEGNQRAIESFRNNMSVDGSPKPDPVIVKLLKRVDDLQRENQRVRELTAVDTIKRVAQG